MRRKNPLTEALLPALLGWTLTIFIFYPGFDNGDASWQLKFAREWMFINWHPPLMSVIWRPIDALLPGTGGLFLFQTFLYWLGVSLCCSKIRFRTILTLLIGCSPALFVGTSMIVKDVLSLGFFLLVLGSLITFQERKSIWSFTFEQLCGLLAIGVRYNTVFAVAPLLAYSCYQFLPFLRGRLALALLTPILHLVLALGFESALISGPRQLLPAVFFNSDPAKTDAHSNFPSQMFMTFDLVGISAITGRSHLPYYFARGKGPLTVQELREIYLPDTALWIFFYPDPNRRSPGFTWSREEYELLVKTWLFAIVTEPSAYLTHRARVMASHLGVKPVWPYWYPGPDVLAKMPRGDLKAWVGETVNNNRDALLYRVWFYLSVTLLLFGYALYRRATLPALIGLSGLLCVATNFFLIPGGDFRYAFTLIAVTHVLPVALLSNAPRS